MAMQLSSACSDLGGNVSVMDYGSMTRCPDVTSQLGARSEQRCSDQRTSWKPEVTSLFTRQAAYR